MAASTTRDALLEQGALLFARHGVAGVTPKRLHEAVGARNESALHYHFGSREGLVGEILLTHLRAVETRRALLVAAMLARGTTADLRSLIHALAAPMADDLADPVGRAHLRIVAELSHPSLAFRPAFRGHDGFEAHAGDTVVTWLRDALAAALPDLPPEVTVERLANLRGQLISLLGLRAQLLDDDPRACTAGHTALFVENLLDTLVAGLTAPVSPATLDALRSRPDRSAPDN